MMVHGRRLARLVAGDLRPELVGLEEHLPDALVGGEVLQRVKVEHLGNASGRRDGRFFFHGASAHGASVYSNGDRSSALADFGSATRKVVGQKAAVPCRSQANNPY